MREWRTFRSAAGRQIELPVYLGTWVLVPAALAAEQAELTWTREYEDAPERMLDEALEQLEVEDQLDFAEGALLVPAGRWDDRNAAAQAALSGGAPSLAGIADGETLGSRSRVDWAGEQFRGVAAASWREDDYDSLYRPPLGFTRRLSVNLSYLAYGGIELALKLLFLLGVLFAGSFLFAVGEWLWGLRHGMSGRDVGNGMVLILAGGRFGWAARKLEAEAIAALFGFGVLSVFIAYAGFLAM